MKRLLAGYFIALFLPLEDAKNLYNRIMNELKKLRSCYVEDVLKEYPNDDLDLAWMFLMDGCATLAFIFCFAEGMDNKTLQILNINKDDVAFAQQDIFLLENQLPLPLFELLINSVNKEQDKKIIRDSINKFISSREIFLPPQPSATKSRKEPSPPSATESGKKPPCHLLDLLREQILDGIILNETNYDMWSQIIEMHIAKREKLSFISGNTQLPTEKDEGYERWYTDNQKVKKWLLMSMSPEIMKRYIRLPTARIFGELYQKPFMMERMNYKSSL
ncbi:hypothetical protein GH714_031831 [Hevea brasiliensis]|uniref:Uncharacterized protein n=1 Tax=Hevea brasiliensis TaxID=3981 RepID=A0A6A6LGG8_HEVBR|nr:hypothetical protein GH714_031831 [Hevea brasiliensis]